ncbi:hypothetical protein Dimus_000897 [Dionaea muscipula]
MPRRRLRKPSVSLKRVAGLSSSPADDESQALLEPIDEELLSALDEDPSSASSAPRSSSMTAMDGDDTVHDLPSDFARPDSQDIHDSALPIHGEHHSHGEAAHCLPQECPDVLPPSPGKNSRASLTHPDLIRDEPPPRVTTPASDFLGDGTLPTLSNPSGHHVNVENGGFKGQCNQLFADNRKPRDDFKLKKVQFQSTDGFLDFSSESIADKYMFEAPYCLIGYFFGSFPGISALRRLCDSCFPDITFCLHNSGWIIFRFPEESQLLQIWLVKSRLNFLATIGTPSRLSMRSDHNFASIVGQSGIGIPPVLGHNRALVLLTHHPMSVNQNQDVRKQHGKVPVSNDQSISTSTPPPQAVVSVSIPDSEADRPAHNVTAPLANVQIPCPDNPLGNTDISTYSSGPTSTDGPAVINDGSEKETEGFQMVKNRKQRKTRGIHSNPEHHQDKPRAQPSP